MRISGIIAGQTAPVTLVVSDGIIREIIPGVSSPDIGGDDVGLSAGLIEAQINGYRGKSFVSFDTTPDDIRAIIDDCRAAGVTHLCPTLFSERADVFEHSIKTMAALLDSDPSYARSVIGLHLEGPYVSKEDGPRGSHRADVVRPPNFAEFSKWHQLSGGRIAYITVAPEYPGMPGFIREVVALGVKVSQGHHCGTADDIDAAVNAGASGSTHLANGMHGLIPRFSNYLFDQLADDRLYAGFITDGQHIKRNALRVYFRAKPLDKTIIVADTVSLGGLPAGVVKREDGVEVRILENGRIEVNIGSGNLAGAGVLLDRCIPFAVSVGVHSLADVFQCVTLNPARFLGVDRRLGSLTPGKSASIILYDRTIGDRLNVKLTMVDGEIVRDAR